MQGTQAKSAHQSAQSFITLHIDQITTPQAVNVTNDIIRLAASIKKYGILSPISVKRSRDFTAYPPQYNAVDGRKRLAAARITGISEIPCQILPESDQDRAVDGIIHNLKLTKLHYFEEAAAYQLLIRDFKLTQSEIASKLQISQSTVANRLRLLAFSKEEQLKIIDFSLTERHARTLLRLKSPKLREQLLQSIRKNGLSVAQTEAEVTKMLQSAPPSIFPTQTPVAAVTPRKFGLQSLLPLYNSIDRALDIFRKTGATVSCVREETAMSSRIIIEIPSFVQPTKQ